MERPELLTYSPTPKAPDCDGHARITKAIAIARAIAMALALALAIAIAIVMAIGTMIK